LIILADGDSSVNTNPRDDLWRKESYAPVP